MRLTLHVLGFELFSAELSTEQTEPEVQAYGDVRSEATADPEPGGRPDWLSTEQTKPEAPLRHFRPKVEDRPNPDEE